MSWSATSSKNQASSKTAGTSLTLPIAGANLAAGNVIVVAVALDNTGTSDGDSALVSAMSCTNITFSKLAEYTSAQGAAGGGATIALWYGIASGTVNTGTNITITHSNVTARGACYQGFTKTGSAVWIAGTPRKFIGTNSDPASQTISGLGNREHLLLMGIAHEAANTLTWSSLTNYTSFNNTSAQCGTSGSTGNTNMTVRAAYRIVSASSDTLDVGASAVSDHAGIYLALDEGDTPPPAVHSSSPALASNTPNVQSAWNANASVSTASFTPPAGSMLVAVVMADTGDDTPSSAANASDITITLSDNRSLAWTAQVERDKGDGALAQYGHVSIHTASVVTSQSMTVTATRSQPTVYSGSINLQVFVVSGQIASPIGAVNKGSATTNDSSASITTTAPNSLLLIGASDWSANGPFTSSDLNVSSGTVSGAVSFMAGYKNTGAAGAQTMDLDAGGSGATQLNWVALEILSALPAATYTATATGASGHTSAAGSATFALPARTATSALNAGAVASSAAGVFLIPSRSATASSNTGGVTVVAGAAFWAPGRTAEAAATLGGCHFTSAARSRARVGFTRIGSALASGTGGTSLAYSPRSDSYLIVLVATRPSIYPGDAPAVEFGVANGTELTLLQETGSAGALTSVYGGAAIGDETFTVAMDPTDANATILVLEYAYNQQANLITALSTFATGDNPNLSQYTAPVTPDADAELALAIVMYPDPSITSVTAGEGWSNFLEIAPGPGFCRAGIEEIPQALASQSYTAAFNTSGAAGHAWNGMWLLLSSPAPTETYTSSADMTAGPAAFVAAATHKPRFTGSLAKVIGPAMAIASGATTKPVFAGSAAAIVGHVALTASGVTTKPLFTGSLQGAVGATRITSDAAFNVPIYTASAARTTGHVGFSGAAASTVPVFTASIAHTILGAAVAGVGVFAAQVFSASIGNNTGAVRATAMAAFTPPLFTAASGVTLAGARSTAGATFDSGIFCAEASLTFSAALCAGNAKFSPPLFLASLAGELDGVEFVATGRFTAGTGFNPAWVTSSKVLVSHA
jgi:hypothetical protein